METDETLIQSKHYVGKLLACRKLAKIQDPLFGGFWRWCAVSSFSKTWTNKLKLVVHKLIIRIFHLSENISPTWDWRGNVLSHPSKQENSKLFLSMLLPPTAPSMSITDQKMRPLVLVNLSSSKRKFEGKVPPPSSDHSGILLMVVTTSEAE